MATCSPKKIRKSVSDSRNEDVISQLPLQIKERILESLPTRDAAKTAILSTQWRDVWLGHWRIVFDEDMVGWCVRKRKALVDMINRVLVHHARPVKKFTLIFTNYCKPMHMPKQSDLDRWFLFLSKNGIEELNISILYPGQKYKLPSCIVSCRTIKHLLLSFFVFDRGINAGCIFPCVTSLVFKHVDFKKNIKGIVYGIPNLENLAFDSCEGVKNFGICAPKLESLSVIGYRYAVGLRWFKLNKLPLEAIKVLCLDASLLWCENGEVSTLMFPSTINLQVIKLYNLSFDSGELTGAMQLLQRSPNLCELEIIASNSPYSPEDIEDGLLENLDGQDLKMLNTLKIEWFSGSTNEMLFVKMLLSKSPALEKVVILESYNAEGPMALEILRALLLFPCASPKVQIVFMDWKPRCTLVDYPEF